MSQFVTVYYQVRVPGDGEFEWFEVNPYGNDNPFEPTSLEEAKAVAEEVGGWVVKITEEMVD